MAKHAVRIMNYNLTLTSDDDKTYIESVAERVERNVKALSTAMPTRNMTEVALFVAMDYCDRYMKSIGDGTSMRGQIKDYLKDSGAARQQLEETKKENELLRAENEKLRARINGTAEAETKKEEAEQEPEIETPAPIEEAPVAAAPVSATLKTDVTDQLFSRKKNKGKKKENKQAAPVRGIWGADAFSESADSADDIMSFFEEKSFSDED